MFEKKIAGAVPGGPRSRGTFEKERIDKAALQAKLAWVFLICCLIVACRVL